MVLTRCNCEAGLSLLKCLYDTLFTQYCLFTSSVPIHVSCIFYTLMNLSIILYPIIMINISFQLFKTFFAVDMNSGVVTQTMTLDRETMATHSFMVQVCDSDPTHCE